MIATSGFLAALQCTEFIFGRAFAPRRTPLGELTALPQTPQMASWARLLYKGKTRGGRGER